MSYILEALADSEQARQQLAVAPRHSLLQVVGEDMPRSRVWPYALAGALLLNAALLQLWLRPALPGSAASIKLPILPQAAETPRAALEPRSAPVTESVKPVADAADDAIRETRSPPSQPERANGSARKPTPAIAVPATASLNPANDNAPVPLTIVLVPKARAKPSAAPAATPAAAPSVAAPAPVAAAATPAAVPSAAAPAAVKAAGAALQAAPAPAGGTDLPPALQRELPALSVAGFIREEGAGSMVIVNDRLAREGDEVAPGVRLEKILGDNLVFNYKGYRFKR